MIQRRLAPTEEEVDASSVRDIVGRGGGQPLDPALKADMEAQFGQDFSAVRVHADAAAVRSAAELSARAYTVGDEVVLGGESPAINSAEGKRMLAHELTHVIQQRQGPVPGTPVGGGISISDPSDSFEQAAEATAAQLMSARAARPERGGPTEALEEAVMAGLPLQRQEDDEEEEKAESPFEQAQGEATAEYQQEAGEAEQAVELAEAGKEEAGAEAAAEEGTELEIEEDQLSQAGAAVEKAEEEEEEEVAV
jgi:hypothetical protein